MCTERELSKERASVCPLVCQRVELLSCIPEQIRGSISLFNFPSRFPASLLMLLPPFVHLAPRAGDILSISFSSLAIYGTRQREREREALRSFLPFLRFFFFFFRERKGYIHIPNSPLRPWCPGGGRSYKNAGIFSHLRPVIGEMKREREED